MPGFFLNRQEELTPSSAEIGAPNLKVLMDLFHCQVEEGDLAIKIRKYLADRSRPASATSRLPACLSATSPTPAK